MTLASLAVKILYINGCILLYALATTLAGLIGLAGHLLAKKIWHLALGKRVLPYRDLIDLTKSLCILGCGAGNMLVSVGLLFLHLAGGLERDYDAVLVQVGIALFGVLCFAVMCVAATAIIAGAFWVRLRCFRASEGCGVELYDEESALLRGPRLCYGSKAKPIEPISERDVDAGTVEDDDPDNVPPPSPPKSVCIRLMQLSSVRNIDVRRMLPGRSAS